MSYVNEQLGLLLQPKGTGVLAEDDLSAAAVHGEMLVGDRVSVSRLLFLVSTVTVGEATLTYKRRPTPGSAVDEVTLGTITVPAATAAGKLMYKNIDPVIVNAGESITYEVTSAATSGAGHYMVKSEYTPQDPRENTDMIESA